MATFALARQHSASQAGQCVVCRETVGERAGEQADVRMGCRCGLHYSCLVQYLQSKLGDRGSVSLRGVCCPSGAQCASYAGASAYFITLADLDNLVDYGASEAVSAVLVDNGVPPLTHEQTAELRAWLEESAALEGLRAWLGDLAITDDERLQLEGVRRGEPAFDALVRRGVVAAAATPGDVGNATDLTAELAAALRARLRPLREGYTDKLDPYVAATTKACPSCSLRSTHWHGHQCHHISPVTRGCPGCRVGYCYRCLATEADNVRERGGSGNCLCGYWSNFCRDITSAQDVAAFVAYKDGIPFDSRCGCVICPECRFEKPCPSCPGNCGVCRGVLNAAPGQANPPTKWVPLRPLKPGAALEARLWEACRQGDDEALADALAEAGEGAAEVANGRDREGRTCLYNACDGGHAACVAMLLAVLGIDVNHAAGSSADPLIRSSGAGHTECVALLLAHPSIDVNHVDRRFGSALTQSSDGGHTEVVRLLLAHPGIDPNRFTSDGWSALIVNSRNDHAECVRLLLAHPGIDVNHANRDGMSALNVCSEKGHAECVALLVAHPGIDVNHANRHSRSALMSSSSAGHTECVRLLLEHPDIDLNKVDRHGSSALLLSSYRGRTECARLLLAHPGIDVIHGLKARLLIACHEGDAAALAAIVAEAGDAAAELMNSHDCMGCTCLLIACEGGHTNCVRLLLGVQDIDINHVDLNGNSALMFSSDKGHTDCVALLLAHLDIDVNNINDALIRSSHRGHTECVRLLLAHPGIDVNKVDRQGSSALPSSISGGHTECVRLLLAHPGIDANHALKARLLIACHEGDAAALAAIVAEAGEGAAKLMNSQHYMGRTCLLIACKGGHTNCVRLLLGVQGIDINHADRNGNSALMLSSSGGHTECVRLLLAHPGIDVNHANSSGSSALILSRSEGHTDCVTLLLTHPGIDATLTNGNEGGARRGAARGRRRGGRDGDRQDGRRGGRRGR